MMSIVYLTTRDDCKFRWFADSLATELDSLGSERPATELIVIDSRLWYVDQRQRRDQFREWTKGRFGDFIHQPPKPSVLQGPTRLTKFDMFCAASARNTAFCYARGTHVAFADDLSVLMPGWASGHLHAMKGHYAMCGATCKNLEMQIDDRGYVTSFKLFPPGQDHRMKTSERDGSVACRGEWLFGGTFSVPMSVALHTNGLDEIYDGIGGEDYDFGIRIERAGCSLFYNRSCATMESEEAHHVETHTRMLRIDKPVKHHGPYSSNYLYHQLIAGKHSWATANPFVLDELRRSVLAGGAFPVPTSPVVHWVDGQPLAEMQPTMDGYFRPGRDDPSLELT